jgi:hypothetical protein
VLLWREVTLVAIIVGFGALRTTAVLTILGHLRFLIEGAARLMACSRSG